MTQENNSTQAEGTEAAPPRVSSLAELLSVSKEEQSAAASAAKAANITNAANAEAAAASREPQAETAAASDAKPKDKADEAAPAPADGAATAARVQQSVVHDPLAQIAPRKSKPAHALFQFAGLCLAALGAALVIAPSASTGAAEWLASHPELRSHGGTLLIAGLCVFGVSILMRAMREMRSTIDEVSAESQRLEGIAAGGRRVFETLDQVRIEHMVLAREVVHLQAKLRRLIDIVSNPDYTASIYRLAASVDQLGKEVDSSMKGRFDDLQQQLGDIAKHATLTEQQLSASLGLIPPLMKEHHETQQQAVKKGFERQQSGADDVEALIEQSLGIATRIEAAMHGQHESVAGNLANLVESSKNGTAELAESLDALRLQLDRSLGEHSEIVRTEFSHLDNRLDMGERSQSAAAGQLSEQITKQFADHADELHEGLNTLAELASNNSRLVKQELGGITQKLEQHAQEQSERMREASEQSIVAAASARNEISAQLARLDQSIEAWSRAQAEQQQESNAQTLEAARATQREVADSLSLLAELVEQKARDQHALVSESAHEARAAADSAGRELGACLEALGLQLERMKGEQREELQRSSQHSLEATAGTRRELSACLDQLAALAAQLERMNGEQREEMQRSSQQSLEATLGARRELATCLDQLATLGVQLQRMQGEHCQELQRTSQQSLEATGSARRELAACLEQLEAKLAQQVRDQQDLVLESALNVQHSAELSKAELVAAFEQVGSRLEQALTADMQAVAEVFDALSAEVRASLCGANNPAAAPQPALAAVDAEYAASKPTQESEAAVSESMAPAPQPELNTQQEIAREFQTHSDADVPIVWPEPQDGTDPWRDPWPRNRN